MTQDQVSLSGHAIEARVYAEDSFGGFLPQAGTATHVQWPTGVRVDEALESGQVVSTSYDPMLGKVIAFGRDREEARRRLVQALGETTILGLTTNTGFLRALAATEEFRDATVDTAWLDQVSYEEGSLARPSSEVPRALAAWAAAPRPDGATPFRSDGWRMCGEHAPVRVDLDPVVVVRADRIDQTRAVGSPTAPTGRSSTSPSPWTVSPSAVAAGSAGTGSRWCTRVSGSSSSGLTSSPRTARPRARAA